MGPIEITGLEGPMMIARARATAARASGEAGLALAPRKSTSSTGPRAWPLIMNS